MRKKRLYIEYIHLTILNNFKSENESININNILKEYSNDSSYFSNMDKNISNNYMYYNIFKYQILEVIQLLDLIQIKNKTFKYLLNVYYINNLSHTRVKINNKGKKFITINANKTQPL